MKFSLKKELEGKLGRAGVLETPHGVIHTPAFVSVGTKAAVKALTVEQVKSLGAEVVLANTYHLYLEPGEKRVKSFGGLHKFMNWSGPIMTDSGGFQVFSLGKAFGKQVSKVARSEVKNIIDESIVGNLAEVSEDGVTFKSHLDGSPHHITPEKSIEIQHDLGADIIFAFDECTSPNETFKYQEEAMERTHRWALRSLNHHSGLIRANGGIDVGGGPALFGVVQGGRDESLRKRSAKYIGGLNFDGFGIGGSFTKEDMDKAVKWVNEILPKEKPRHLLGIGEPEDLFMGVENGVDLFDCVAPTRNGRGGTLYTAKGKINIRNAEFRDDNGPLDPDCGCEVCHNYSRGYLCHLYRAHEMLGGTLGSMHNLYFIINLVKRMRQAILGGDFQEFKKDFLSKYK